MDYKETLEHVYEKYKQDLLKIESKEDAFILGYQVALIEVKKSFEQYLINVGIRSTEFTYPHNIISENIEYFRTCYLSSISEYNALCALNFNNQIKDIE